LSISLKDHYYELVNEIYPTKDVEALCTQNYAKIFSDGFDLENIEKIRYPPTALGCLLILKHYNVNLKGKKAVVVGRSNYVG